MLNKKQTKGIRLKISYFQPNKCTIWTFNNQIDKNKTLGYLLRILQWLFSKTAVSQCNHKGKAWRGWTSWNLPVSPRDCSSFRREHGHFLLHLLITKHQPVQHRKPWGEYLRRTYFFEKTCWRWMATNIWRWDIYLYQAGSWNIQRRRWDN